MANTLKFGDNNWAFKDGKVLAYNDEDGNFKPLPFDFTRATIGTRVNKSGLIETMQSGIPRIDFLNNTKGHLLLEPQRTNLMPYSEDFTQWSNINSTTITTNYTTSPEGVNNASRLQLSGGGLVEESISGTFESQTHTVSVYAKSLTGNDQTFRLKCTHAGVANYFSSNLTATDEWQRFEFTRAFGSTTGTGIIAGVHHAFDSLPKDIAFYGFQVEANASYATSYIPTSGASVTRNAEVCTQTPPTGIIGQTEGVIFIEMSALADDGTFRQITLSDGTSNNLIHFDYSSSANGLRVFTRRGGVASSFTYTMTDTTANAKFALRYAQNDFVLFIDGVKVVTNTSCSVPESMSDIEFDNGGGSNQLEAKLRQFVLFTTALTDEECIALTTL